jgi:hypothetical protein
MEPAGQSVVSQVADTIVEAEMPEDTEQYREAAEECIRAARKFADDPDAAAILLVMAGNFIDLAEDSAWRPHHA